MGKCPFEVVEKLVQIEIREPGVDNEGLRDRRLGLGPGLGAAFGLTHLPAEASKNLREPLAEASVGAGNQRGANTGASVERGSGNGNESWEHGFLLVDATRLSTVTRM
jgi:hypothetical protein